MTYNNDLIINRVKQQINVEILFKYKHTVFININYFCILDALRLESHI